MFTSKHVGCPARFPGSTISANYKQPLADQQEHGTVFTTTGHRRRTRRITNRLVMMKLSLSGCAYRSAECQLLLNSAFADQTPKAMLSGLLDEPALQILELLKLPQ
jgi:hypothetical protein